MNKHIIEHFIPKQAEGTYCTIPFPVPEGLECVTVSYSYKRLSGAVAHLLMVHPRKIYVDFF